ncbi:hypothetical protein CC80DRAFT_431767, partial [Byssothecium circinans]
LPTLSPLVGPFHLFSYSTLLGTQLYQSFVMVKVAYQALPYEAFTTLQKRVFPAYFRCQSILLFVTAASLPPHGPASLVKEAGSWIPLMIAGGLAALNLVVYGPRTSRIMMVRRYQADIDSRKAEDGVVSDEMKKLNRSFKWNHAMSIHLNLITIGATLWYG